MVCTYGASVKAGLSPTTQVIVDRYLWEQVTGTPSSWLDPFLDLFIPSTIQLSDLCALNLADPVLPSAATFANAIRGDFVSIGQITDYIRDKLRYAAFVQGCTCNPAPTVCNTAQEVAGGWTAGACATGVESEGFEFTAIGDQCKGGWLYTPHTPMGAYSAQNVSLWSVTSGTKVAGPLLVNTPGDIDSVTHFAWASVVTLVPTQHYVICIEKANANCYAFKSIGVPSTAQYTGVGGKYASGNSTLPVTASGVMPGIEPEVCSAGSPTTPVSPTQPSQPGDTQVRPDWTCVTACDIMARLQQVMDTIGWLRRDVTLIQRQHVPFGYIVGTPDVGLTGDGTLFVSSILGARIVVTAHPAGWGTTADIPARYIPKLGAIYFADAYGNQDERQIHYDEQYEFDAPGWATELLYSLRPGVTVTITRLLREP